MCLLKFLLHTSKPLRTVISYTHLVDGRFETVLGARPKHAEVVIDEELADSLSKEDVASYAKRVIDKLQYGSNIRGSKQYRKQLSKVLISRCISRLTEE